MKIKLEDATLSTPHNVLPVLSLYYILLHVRKREKFLWFSRNDGKIIESFESKKGGVKDVLPKGKRQNSIVFISVVEIQFSPKPTRICVC